MYRYKQWVIWALLLVTMVPIHAQTKVSILPSTIQWRNTHGGLYSPFDQRGFYYKVMVTVHIPPNEPGDYFLGFGASPRQLTHSGPDTLRYFLTKAPQTNQYLMNWPQAISADHVVPFLVADASATVQQFSMYIWVDPGQHVVPDRYTGTIPVHVYKGQPMDANPIKIAYATLTLYVEVDHAIHVVVGHESGTHASEWPVSFDQLRDGEVATYPLFIHTTQPYQLTIMSKYHGHLRHDHDSIQTAIPYQLYVDQIQVHWDPTGVAQLTMQPTSGTTVTRHEVKLILGETQHAFKGDYSDTITVHATAGLD